MIALLANDPNANIRITLEIDAEFAHGASDTIKRGVSENGTSLGFKTKKEMFETNTLGFAADFSLQIDRFMGSSARKRVHIGTPI